MPEDNAAGGLLLLMDVLNDLDDAQTEALFETIAELDPLATDEDGPKYTPVQRDTIGRLQSAYRDSGLSSD